MCLTIFSCSGVFEISAYISCDENPLSNFCRLIPNFIEIATFYRVTRWRHRAEAQSQLTASLQTLRREFVARALRASWLAWKRRCQEAVALRVCQRSAMSKVRFLTSFRSIFSTGWPLKVGGRSN